MEAGHKIVEPKNNSKSNLNHSTFADPHPKISNYAQINKLIDTENHDGDDDDKTMVSSNCTKMFVRTPTDHAIFDLGAIGHFLLSNAPMNNKQQTSNPLFITLPDGCMIASTHTCLLDMPPVTARFSQIVPDLDHASLISVKQFCDVGYRVEYDAIDCYVYLNNNIILHGP